MWGITKAKMGAAYPSATVVLTVISQNPYGLNEEDIFHRFDLAVWAENTMMCQLWPVGRLKVKLWIK